MATIPLPAPSIPGYQQFTQAAVLAMLSDRLGDTGNVYWSAAELRLYIAEALRTWQALTGWYRQRAVVATQANTAWYDLTSSLVPVVTGGGLDNVFGYNVTDQNLASVILYHLLERQLSGGWAGTDQFDLATVQNAIQNRASRFLSDTGAVVSYVVQQSGISPPVNRALILTNVIDLRRVAWISAATGQTTVLWRSDDWQVRSFLAGSGVTPQDPPSVYTESGSPPSSIVLAPAPSANGALEMLAVLTAPTINLTGTGVLLNVPDDFTWGVKFGAMADLLMNDGQAQDAARAQYCEQRYQEAVTLAKTFPAVLQTFLLGQPIFTSSVFDLDAFSPGWQNLAPGTPLNVGIAGRNLIALSPAPATTMNVAVDLIRNMPIPFSDTDLLQVPPDVVPVLVDYAQHLASFKMGGQEFLGTDMKRVNLLMEAANYNGRLREMNFFNDAIRSPGQTQQAEVTRTETPALYAYKKG